MTDTSVINLIIDRTVAQLQVELVDKIVDSDPTRAGLVRAGLLQASPLPNVVNVLVFENDPDKPDAWLHSTTTYDISNGIKNPPGWEINGSTMFWRRFSIQFEMFWAAGTERQTARNQANVVLSRTERALRKMNSSWNGTDDSFGEAPQMLYVMRDQISDAGGTGKFIHHGKIWFQVLTGTQLEL